ncbi:MAG: protein kinase [Polyangiaceae bacterium]|nr:protein kinase [Polyangiaceae bacterium]
MTSAPSSIRLVEGEARRWGGLDLIARLGHGGMAEVFLAARRERPAELIVVKRLKADLDDAEHRGMFAEESRIMPLLTHPNIVRTTEVGEEEGRQYLALEFLDGLTLDRCADKVTALGERAAFHVVAELLEGLHYAHEVRDPSGATLELVHRDVSPHNVFITYEGRVTLVDFGIARRRGRAYHTATGVVRGKLEYMAPEQALCDTLDRRADVFAAGVILWELLSGRPYWDDASDVQILKRMTFGDLPKLGVVMPDVRPEVEALLSRALAVKPEDRFETARAFREAIAAVRGADSERPPLRRTELAATIAGAADGYRSGLRALVDRHLEAARDTSGLPGISAAATSEPNPVEAPVSARAEAEEPKEEAQAAAPVSSREAEPISSGRAPSTGERPITETGAATILEVKEPEKPKRFARVAPLLVAVGIGVAIAAVVGSRFSRSEGRAAEASPPVETTSTAASAPADPSGPAIRVSLRVSPSDAVVHLDGMRVRTLPLDAKFPKDGAGHKLTVNAEGYDAKSQIVVFDRDVDLDVTLDPARAAAPATSASADAVSSARPRTIPRASGTSPLTSPTSKETKGFIESDPWKRDGKKR